MLKYALNCPSEIFYVNKCSIPTSIGEACVIDQIFLYIWIVFLEKKKKKQMDILFDPGPIPTVLLWLPARTAGCWVHQSGYFMGAPLATSRHKSEWSGVSTPSERSIQAQHFISNCLRYEPQETVLYFSVQPGYSRWTKCLRNLEMSPKSFVIFIIAKRI